MHRTACILAAIALCVPFAQPQGAAILQGHVRDSQGRPVVATLSLQPEGPAQTLTARADAQGRYQFSALRPGSYTIRAQAGEAGEAVMGPFLLGETETKKLDLTVQAAFFDEPNFIVAGVTDTVSRGGHGSDTVMRSAETLAKATAALSKEAATPANAGRGDALETVRGYQRAAEAEASEANLFAWGSELLKHRAYQPAAEVFAKGNRLFPGSLRMLLGLASACYARGAYHRAATLFFAACDLDPGNPEPYLFLGQVRSTEITELEGYLDRLRRFAERQPGNAWANYYYAVGLWNQRKGSEDAEAPAKARELLQNAIRIDPDLGVAYLQLGIIYSEQNDSGRAIAAFQKAIELSPGMEEPHYRLGQVYGRAGDKVKARQELEIYQQMSRKSAEQAERERAEMQQFVFEPNR